ncbi:hypothetical protein FNV43_RR08262 [Rhamnella rubrinervis]|uniref:Uncharacterized protein n=1 Tax=Rhamnella rubrinervis TaxID=2594499 RepID=A0A8K0MN81_9ROSA|nr:hypothetical protein FNV43_RR08262 [Rhamnella rubrinervis]
MPSLHSPFRRLWRTKVPLGVSFPKAGGTRKQQTPLFYCLGETPRTTRIEDAPLVLWGERRPPFAGLKAATALKSRLERSLAASLSLPEGESMTVTVYEKRILPPLNTYEVG